MYVVSGDRTGGGGEGWPGGRDGVENVSWRLDRLVCGYDEVNPDLV